MPDVSFYTLGCRLNYADTGGIRSDFVDRGYRVVPFGESADVAVINSCSVTEEADRKCRQIVRRALRANPNAFVIVTGCYAQLQPGRLAAIDGVDAVVGTAEKFRIFDLIESFEKAEATQVEVSCIDLVSSFGRAASGPERTRAFLKVQDGCDYTCAFCTIPMARGKSRSDAVASVVERAQQLHDDGFPEVVLTGVNLGLFSDGNATLLDLLERLDRDTSVPRFRLSSVEPNLLTDEIIDFVAGSRSFMHHFHMPLQSGSDEILGKMRRRYQRADYVQRVDRILSTIPDACIGADVIVGHPGETDDHFMETVRFISKLPVAYLHVFSYSERPNTVSVDRQEELGSIVPVAERKRRCRQLRALSEKKRIAFYRRQVGRRMPVVWEDKVDPSDNTISGYTHNFVRLKRPFDSALVGSIQTVSIDPGALVLSA